MTLSELRTRVYYRLGRSGDDTLDNEILDALNAVQREVSNTLNIDVLRISATLTMVAGTQAYNLASDFLRMDTIWNDNTYGHELVRIKPSEYKLYGSDIDTTQGTLQYYDMHDTAASSGTQVKKISFIPVPNAVATVPYHYYKKLSDLSAATDENVLTEWYPDLYIEGAAYMLYRDNIYRDNPERIAFRKAEYEKQIEVLRRAERKIDRVDKISPKRIIPTTNKLYSTQYEGYTS